MGHARTFWIAAKRAQERGGVLVLRNEDLDPQRCQPEFVAAMYEDLRWLGIRWSEGPDCGGPYAPYSQSERRSFYLEAWQRLRDISAIYPAAVPAKNLRRLQQRPMIPTMNLSIPAIVARAQMRCSFERRKA